MGLKKAESTPGRPGGTTTNFGLRILSTSASRGFQVLDNAKKEAEITTEVAGTRLSGVVEFLPPGPIPKKTHGGIARLYIATVKTDEAAINLALRLSAPVLGAYDPFFYKPCTPERNVYGRVLLKTHS